MVGQNLCGLRLSFIIIFLQSAFYGIWWEGKAKSILGKHAFGKGKFALWSIILMRWKWVCKNGRNISTFVSAKMIRLSNLLSRKIFPVKKIVNFLRHKQFFNLNIWIPKNFPNRGVLLPTTYQYPKTPLIDFL